MFFAHIFKLIDTEDSASVILGGDFNVPLELGKDTNATTDSHPKSRELILHYIEHHDMWDAWRTLNEKTCHFTWSSRRKNKVDPIFSRLDYFLVSGDNMNQMLNCKVMPGYRSDHSCIQITLQNNEIQRGRGLWKFNTQYLSDLTFVQQTNELLQKSIKDNKELDDGLGWEMMKIAFTRHTQEYARVKAKERRSDIAELEKELAIWTQKYQELPDQNTLETIIDLEQKHQEKMAERLKE